MSNPTDIFARPPTVDSGSTPNRRIEELRAREAVDINHGDALLLQGMAAASLREQRIVSGKIDLDARHSAAKACGDNKFL